MTPHVGSFIIERREEALWIAAALLVVGALVVLVDGEGGKRVLNGAMTQARVLDIHR